MVRPFDIRDVGIVQRLGLSGRTLAYEPFAVDGLNPLREAMRAYVSPGRDHAIALVRRDQDRELDAFGLMHIIPNRNTSQSEPRCAALLFMAPSPATDELQDAWTGLSESFCVAAGERGAQCVVAEAPEAGREVEALTAAGFSPLIHQDIMKLASIPKDFEAPEILGMRKQEEKDEAYVKLLSLRVVPRLIQKAEASTDLTRLTHRTDCGFLLMSESEAIGHVSVRQGRRGSCMQVLFRPEAEDLAETALRYVLANLCGRPRPVYCMVPSYQSWLLPIFDELGFSHVTSTVVLVKHLTARVRQPVWSIQPGTAHANLIKTETKLQPHKLDQNQDRNPLSVPASTPRTRQET
jgi:hypothetical protein